MNNIVHIFARESTIQFTDPTSGETRIVERRTPGEDAELIGNIFRTGDIYFGVKKVITDDDSFKCSKCGSDLQVCKAAFLDGLEKGE